MGMAVGGKKGGPVADINVTPMADIMIVLLIIFMVITPMLQKGLDVKLPVASNSSDKPETQDQTVLGIKSDRSVYVNSVMVPMSDLRRKMEEALESKTQKVVFIKAPAASGNSTSPAILPK